MKTPLTPLEAVLRTFAVHGERPALQEGDLRLTYREFAEATARLMALLGRSLHAGGHALLIAPNTACALLAFHAVPLCGGVIVPLNPAFSDEALNFLTRHADPQVAFVDAAHLPRVQGTLTELGIPVLVIGDGSDFLGRLSEFAPAPLTLPAGLDEDAPISVNYTSGTTSDPKGVMLTHRNAAINSMDMLYHLNLRPSSVYLHALPLTHGNGWGCAWTVTVAGAAHVILRDPADLRFGLSAEAQITHLCASPAILGPLADHPFGMALPKPVRVLIGGTSPRSSMIAALQAKGFEVLHGYGLIETSAVLTITDLSEELLPPDPYSAPKVLARQGHPMVYGGQIEVVSEDGAGVPHDGQTPGEIVIRSNVVMKGYYKNRAATRRAIKDGWLHTGDLAVIHEGGRLEILDREGDLLKIGGQAISSVQIEAVLYRHPSVREAVVVAAHDDTGDLPVAFVTLHAGAQVQGREILSFCTPHLPDYALPRRVQLVADLPKTASGKVLKHVLRAKANETADALRRERVAGEELGVRG